MARNRDERSIQVAKRRRERRYREEQRTGWGRDDFLKGAGEFERFETLTRDLLTVPKTEIDKKRKKN